MLDLFPTGLDNSLFPAIFLGVLVTFLAVETLGWTFTGLVVPGYLASVALVAPRAAGLMVIEGLVTMALVRLISDGASSAKLGSRFFGRERFFFHLAIATLVRLAVDLVLLPYLQGKTGDLGAFAFTEADRPAHSIGLVLVPLMSHTLDKVGALRGVMQLGALTGITTTLLLALLKWTNLTLADLSLTFEDVAFRIDQSPKSYVVLLAGALLAARANVAFGWDFHGIIVPGLLAVAWFTPGKVLVTLVEAIAVLLLARGLTMLPGLRNIQVEGPRRLVLLFCSDAILKIGVVTAMGHFLPGIHPSDLYGFGYLLPTLLAAKIWQKQSYGRVLWPATQVSVGGFLLGNGIMLVLGRAVVWLTPLPAAQAAAPVAAPSAPMPFERAVAVGKSYVSRDGEKTRLSAAERGRWEEALSAFSAGERPDVAFGRLRDADLAVVDLAGEEGAVRVHERVQRLMELRGQGSLVARAGGRRVVVGLPRPLEGDLTLVASDVARALDARAVVVSGRPDATVGQTTGALLTPTPYLLARRGLSTDAWVELAVDEKAPAGGVLHVPSGTWPQALELEGLKKMMPGLEVRWDGRGDRPLDPAAPASQLVAPAATWRALAVAGCKAGPAVDLGISPAALLERPAQHDDDLDLAERLLLAEGVVSPLVAAARLVDAGGTPDGGSACRAATALGLDLATLRDAGGVVHTAVMPGERRGAIALVRSGASKSTEEHLVGVPRAASEPYTQRAGFALYESLGARALLIGAPAANARASTYDVALEGAARALDDAQDGVAVLEVRGGGEAPVSLENGSVLAWGGVGGAPDLTPAWVHPLAAAVERVGIDARGWDGAPELGCCGDLDSMRRSGLSTLGRARLATLYVAPTVREDRFGSAGVAGAAALAEDLGLRRLRAPFGDALATASLDAPCTSADELGATLKTARRWAELRHIADLNTLAARPGVQLASDPITGEEIVMAVSRCGDVMSVGAVNLRDRGEKLSPTRELPAGATLADDAFERLRFGGTTALFAPSVRAPVDLTPAPGDVR